MSDDDKLTECQRQAVLLAASAHRGEVGRVGSLAGSARQAGLPARDVEALVAGEAPDDPGLALVVAVTWLLIDTHGSLDRCDRADLLDAGVEPAVCIEVAALVGVAIGNTVDRG